MAQTVILHGHSQREHAKRLIDKAPKEAVLTIREAKRSLAQNDLMWAKLSEISIAKPEGRMHTPETWKNLFLHACGHAVQFEVGLDNKPFPVGFRSSRLTVSQMKDLIDFIDEYAASHGITWKNEEAA